MKKSALLIVFVFLFNSLSANQVIRFTVSKPYCVLNFLQTMIGSAGTSNTLKAFVQEQPHSQDPVLNEVIEEFRNTELNYSFKRHEYPEHRHSSRSTRDLIQAAAIKSESLEEFEDRIVGILPNTEHQKLMHALNQALPFYDQIIWQKYEADLHHQLKQLETKAASIKGIFDKLVQFYGTSWTGSIPFLVSIYPVPGERGHTTATPHGNALAIGVLTEEKDPIGRMAVIVHEMSHVLYDEQPPDFQHLLEDYFLNHSSPYSKLAYGFFDEALATACGNGWAYSVLAGKEDPSKWYNNAYINAFSKSIYPEVKSYIEAEKRMDSTLIQSAVDHFELQFPKSLYDAHILLNSVYLYHDGASSDERKRISAMLGKYFQIHSSHSSSPVQHTISQERMAESSGCQLILLFNHFDENMALLARLFPSMKKWLQNNKDDYFMLRFYDPLNRPVFILRAPSLETISRTIEALDKDPHIDNQHPYFKIHAY